MQNKFTSLSVESHDRVADTSSAISSGFLPCHLLTPLKYFIKYFSAAVIT